jgi:thymidylate synthase
MERFWPKWANDGQDYGHGDIEHMGIRYEYGDLNDLLHLLEREPHTRQAYLPIWFPEDIHAAAIDHQRVPCTLGYHFMLRDDQLHCFYPMRSVDYVRYLRDDIYMAGLLVQWIIAELNAREVAKGGEQAALWHYVEPGKLTLFASSLHIFEGDVPKLMREDSESS